MLDATMRKHAKQWLLTWQSETDLAGLRETEALAKLSEEERSDCLALWKNLEEIIKAEDQ